MTVLSAHRIKLDLPPGWDGSIYRRQSGDGSVSYPVLHASSFELPAERGDFGGGAVEMMGPSDMFVALFEYGPTAVVAPLFSHPGISLPLLASHFHPHALQRAIRGQVGLQRFFRQSGRAFSLYVVLGSLLQAPRLAGEISSALATLHIGEVTS